MFLATTHRPRNVDAPRAAALLYGDLGTSKAYVIGLAFALAGYASFWLVAAVSLLTILIGINYIIICKYYPNGGGVYASVRHRSEALSLIGAFFIIADYVVTAALSALSAFSYLNVSDPVLYSALFIGLIGILNYFGPRHTGSLAFIAGLFTFLILTVLLLLSIPHMSTAWQNIQPLQAEMSTLWKQFVGVIVALSGIEAIANTTGVMQLDPLSTEQKPYVTRTAKRAIITVICEVAIYTTLFAFVINAIDSFTLSHGTVTAPGHPDVRDYMLKYLGEVFVGEWFGVIVGIALAILLLSAVNTAIVALVSLQYLMAHDQELPSSFQKVNRFGVPLLPLLIATAIPILLLLSTGDIVQLAALYAIGFVGAIATNLGSTSTDFTLALKKRERLLMFGSFLIMAAIEITIFFDKPAARIYVLAVILIGFFLKSLSKRRREEAVTKLHPSAPLRPFEAAPPAAPRGFAILCVVKNQRSRALEEALAYSTEHNAPLYLLFIKEQEVMVEADRGKRWQEDPQARALFSYAKERAQKDLLHFHYCVSDAAAQAIVGYALKLRVRELLLDFPRAAPIYYLFRGNQIKEIRRLLSPEPHITIRIIK